MWNFLLKIIFQKQQTQEEPSFARKIAPTNLKLHFWKQELKLQIKFQLHLKNFVYTVMQSDRNSSKMDTFHTPTTYEPHV